MKAQKSFNALKIDITNHFNRSIQLGFQPSPAMIKQWGINRQNAIPETYYPQLLGADDFSVNELFYID